MTIRELLRKIRLRSVQVEGENRTADNVDALAVAGAPEHASFSSNVPPGATIPPGYVPSQQDERPH